MKARTVKLSEASARALAGGASEAAANVVAYVEALRELNAALARLDRTPKSKPRPEPHPLKSNFFRTPRAWRDKTEIEKMYAPRKRPSKAQKHQETASIREAVFARASGRCEGPSSILGAGRDGRCVKAPNQLAHAFGRGKGRRPQSERNCMALCDGCAYFETHNQPSAAFWWTWRADFFEALGYTEEALACRKRVGFVEVRAALGRRFS